jgi:hypothetical protein
MRKAEHRSSFIIHRSAVRTPQSALTALLLAVTLLPAFLRAQPVATETRLRIHLPTSVKTPDNDDWSEYRSAESGEFPWAPAQQFWQGYISTSKLGQKSGLFIAVFDPHSTMSMNDIHQSAASSFEEDGADIGESKNMTISGYDAEEMVFGCSKGNGLYFTGGSTGTSVSFIFVVLEKEKTTTVHPFLACYFAAPAGSFEDLRPVFDDYVKKIVIDPLYGSITGRATSQASGIGISGIAVQLLSSKTSQTVTRNTQSDGTYRFDSLAGGNYYLTLAQTPGFKPQAQPTIIELAPGADTAGLDFRLEATEAPVAEPKVKPNPKPEGPPSELRFGIGYRHRLNDIWGAGVNLRAGNLVPEFTLGLDVGGESGDTTEAGEGRLFLSLGASYYFLHADNAHLGLGLYGMTQVLGSKTMLGAEVPLTVEYFILPKLSVQASTGVVLTDLADKVNFSIGPQNVLGSLGFTWYLK